MSLKQILQVDLTKAVKDRNEIASGTLRMLLASISNREKEKRYRVIREEPELTEEELVGKSQLTDEEIIEVIFSEMKKRKEAIAEYQKGKREDLIKKEKSEIEVLQKYLPEQLSESEIKKLAQETIEKTGAQDIKDIGKVMSELMPKVKGKADGTEVSKIVKELLS